MKKEQIEKRIEEVKGLTLDSQKDQSNLLGELAELQDMLAQLNAPTITDKQAEDFRDRFIRRLEDFDFDNPDSYEFEFEIDFDNVIRVSSMVVDRSSPSNDDIIEECLDDLISDFFNVVD